MNDLLEAMLIVMREADRDEAIKLAGQLYTLPPDGMSYATALLAAAAFIAMLVEGNGEKPLAIAIVGCLANRITAVPDEGGVPAGVRIQ